MAVLVLAGVMGMSSWVRDRMRSPVLIFTDPRSTVIWDNFGETTYVWLGHHGERLITRKPGYRFYDTNHKEVKVQEIEDFVYAEYVGASSFPFIVHGNGAAIYFVDAEGRVHKGESLEMDNFTKTAWKQGSSVVGVSKGGVLTKNPGGGSPATKVQLKSSALAEWGIVAVDEDRGQFAFGRRTVLDIYDFKGRHLRQIKLPAASREIGTLRGKFYVIDEHYGVTWEDGRFAKSTRTAASKTVASIRMNMALNRMVIERFCLRSGEISSRLDSRWIRRRNPSPTS